MTRPSLWWLGAAFVVWCSALVVLYAVHSVGCIFGWPIGALRVALVLLFIAHLIVIGWMWRRFARSEPDPVSGQTGAFLHGVVVWTVIAAFASTVFMLGPPLLLSVCI